MKGLTPGLTLALALLVMMSSCEAVKWGAGLTAGYVLASFLIAGAIVAVFVVVVIVATFVVDPIQGWNQRRRTARARAKRTRGAP